MSDQERFIALQQRYYQAWFRYHPEQAVNIGVPGYADQLPPVDDDEIGALVALNEKLLSTLGEITLENLTPAAQLDYQLLFGSAMIEGHELLECDWRLCSPQGFLPIQAIYQLTVKPVADMAQNMARRLEAIPGHLRKARTYLGREPERIPALWLEAAIQEAVSGVAYFQSLKNHPELAAVAANGVLEEAGQALAGFARFLERDLGPRANGDFAVGERRFVRHLQHRHFLDLTPDQLLAFGQNLFDKTRAELEAVTEQLRGDRDVAALTRQIQERHPSQDKLQDNYLSNMLAARDFVKSHDLVSFPSVERLDVVATPTFLRHQIPFAAYMEPAVNDERQRGFYYVTPVEHAADLGEHNHLAIMHTCVHESYPGHHLQFVTANLNTEASSVPRLTNPSATLYEGWALYCEQLMVEQGFLAAPESRFLVLKDRLWRALRIIIDVEIQTRGMSIGAAANRMQELLGFSAGQARADLTWYSMAPTVPMGYGVGWALINAARDCLHLQQPDLSLKEFHDQLLAEGSVALPAVLRKRFGQDTWQNVKQMVFGQAH